MQFLYRKPIKEVYRDEGEKRVRSPYSVRNYGWVDTNGVAVLHSIGEHGAGLCETNGTNHSYGMNLAR